MRVSVVSAVIGAISTLCLGVMAAAQDLTLRADPISDRPEWVQFTISPAAIDAPKPEDIARIDLDLTGTGQTYQLHAAPAPWSCFADENRLMCEAQVSSDTPPLPEVQIAALSDGSDPSVCVQQSLWRWGHALPESLLNGCVGEAAQPVQPLRPALALSLEDAACRVDISAQEYRCDISATLANMTKRSIDGPVALVLRMSDHPATRARIAASGWVCGGPIDSAMTCYLPDTTLSSRAVLRDTFALTLPAASSGGRMRVCVQQEGVEEGDLSVLQMQAALRGQGFAPGPLDGQSGRRTRAAIAAFQGRAGLPETGEADAQLRAALGLGGLRGDTSPACVTLDLTPMPGRGLSCRAGETALNGTCVESPRTAGVSGAAPSGPACDPLSTRVASDGSCECRYHSMVQITINRCSCGNGLPPVLGAGCVALN